MYIYIHAYSEKLYMCLNYYFSLIFSLVQSSIRICVIAFGIIGPVLALSVNKGVENILF